MPRFPSYDATELAYHVLGSGPPLVCLPGGPGRASSYLGELGGLTRNRTLLLLDHRGTGESAVPANPTSYRVDRLVDDVEAFRVHLGLDRMELLAHCAAGDIAGLYAARLPERLARLVLVAPGLVTAGVEPLGFDEALAARAGEWWYPEAKAAVDGWRAAVERGADEAELARLRAARAPFGYGRWNERTRAHHEAEAWERAEPAADGFHAESDPDPESVRAGLGAVGAPVLIVTGGLDPSPTPAAARALAGLFPNAEVTVQDGAGHFPWLDDPVRFVDVVRGFLRADRPTGVTAR